MATPIYTIPTELNSLIKSNCVNVSDWTHICALIQPFPEQHIILSTNAPNNTIILATKIFDLMGIDLLEFKLFTVINDIYEPERNHGIYTYNNKYVYMDMKRIRYDDYKYMTRILESIIYSQRINIPSEHVNESINEIDETDETNKIVIVINNFDLILQQYLPKFIKYADTLSANVIFIYIGSGVINYYSQSTKLKGLCIVKRCMFQKLQSILNNIPLTTTSTTSTTTTTTTITTATNTVCDMLYNFTDGDIIKSWLILQIFNEDAYTVCSGLNTHCNATAAFTHPISISDTYTICAPLTTMQLFEKYILPNMPILNSIYELLILIRSSVLTESYSITPIMNKLYILHSYPDMNICRIINSIFKIFTFIHAHDTIHNLYLSKTNIIELSNLCNTFTSMDKIKPYVFNEPILILRGFITKLLLFLSKPNNK